MANDQTVIRIDSDNHGGRTRVGVNGTFVEVPHNEDFPIHVAYVGALKDSNVEFKIVSGAVPRSLSSGAEGEGALPSAPETIPVNEPVTDESSIRPDRANAETPDGADASQGGAGPIDGAASSATAAPAEMAQGSQGHDGMTADQKAAEPKTTPEPAIDNQDTPSEKSEAELAEDEDTRRAAADDEARKAAEADDFNADELVKGNIADISKGLDGYSADQIQALIDAEKKGQNRTTLLDALSKRVG